MLTLDEKKYLLAIERGDLPNVRRMLQRAHRKKTFDINCVDSLGRGALTIAIDQENLEMVELLVVMGVDTKDALLYAISVEFVEAVELLLEHEELIHKEGEPYSWQKVDINTAVFTPDITPLILAAHRNNYEILKILLDRGATIPMPHDIKCGCEDCISESEEDSLRHSLSRLNEYKALASPSLIALSSSDPLLTAFQLSWELRNLAFAEPESKSEYMTLRKQCQEFAVDLLQQSRSSQELAIILNHDPDNPPYKEGEHMTLARLELAILYKQKKFVAHPNIQQLLAALWYEGVPGFRRKSNTQKIMIIVKVALLFPLYCLLYTFAPGTRTGKLMRKPFMKFLIHASSYLFFLLLLILVSLRAEDLFFEYFGSESMKAAVLEKYQKQRGNTPTFLEYAVLIYVIGFIVEETQEIFTEGINSYLKNLWNFIDFTRNLFYTLTFALRALAYIQQTTEIEKDPSTAYLRREQWHAFDPQLIAEGLFAAANIFSALKLVHLFSINPHLGPLQISLGRMVIDIVKFFFIYSLVLFAFACGLNQLLWYFSDLEKQKCYHLPNGQPDFDNAGDSCMKWRRFANVFESSQSLFWASFGMVDLESFELTGIKTYTRFWGLLMFGSYSVINVIVLLNLLIAMMSNSYAMITEHSDTEWKFARTKLWMSYFEESGTLPPPFNIFPKPKHLFNLLGLRKKDKFKRMSTKRRNREEKERDYRYTAVMRALVWRYVSAMHRKADENQVTEDDINELKSDVSTFRYELLEVLSKNGLDTSCAEKKEKAVLGKKMKVWERRLMKDFKVAPVSADENDDLFASAPEGETSLARFRRIAKMAALDSTLNKWQQVVKGACIASQIGRCHTKDSFKKQQNLQKAIQEAKRLTAKSPDSSRSATPLTLPDFTGAEIIKLVKEDVSPDDTIKSRVSINPNVTVMSENSKALIISPTISVIPPQSPILKQREQEDQPTPREEPDLINLESTQSSPLPSLKKTNDISNTSPSDSLNRLERNERETAFDVSDVQTATQKMAVDSLGYPGVISPALETPSTSPIEELQHRKSPTKSPELGKTENLVEHTKLPEDSESPVTSLGKVTQELEKVTSSQDHVSSPKLRFEMAAKENESDEFNRIEKEGFSSGDSESCDELNRIMSPEGTLDSSRGLAAKKSPDLEFVRRGVKELDQSDVDQEIEQQEDEPTENVSDVSKTEDKDGAILEIRVEKEIKLLTSDLKITDIRPMTPRPPTPQPLSPPPESPPREASPMSQRHIQRIHDTRRPPPKYGWL